MTKKSSPRRLKIIAKAIFLVLTVSIFINVVIELINLSDSKFQSHGLPPHQLINNSTKIKKIIQHKVVERRSPASEKIPTESTTETPTLNPIYEYSEEENMQAENDFKERREHLNRVCEQSKMKNVLPPNAKEFIITHQLAWCTIFKSASTNWLYFFNILSGYDVKYLQRTIATPIDLARRRMQRPSLEELYEALENSISFLIVREPFERLLSAYRNKFEDGKNAFYKALSESIIKQFREHGKNDTNSWPSFKEFLQHIVHRYQTKKPLDEHWSPYWKFCTPCSINFTLIMKLETFQRDTNYLIRSAGLESLLIDKVLLPKSKVAKITNRSKSDTNSLISQYFSQINKKLLREILDIYQLDFELFNYDYKFYFNIVTK